jgi:formylglycine-generating enzyme required for sulfatase activity
MHLLLPYEFHASTTELVQLLEASHHGVNLDAESWDRLNTWIDLNTPAWGTWEEMVTQSSEGGTGGKRMGEQRQHRRELTLRYSGIDDDTDAVYPAPDWKPEVPPAEPKREVAAQPQCEGWPFDMAEAQRRQQNGSPASMKLDLGEDVSLTLVRIPPGRFVAGGGTSSARAVEVPKAFWMSACEISNEQYARFNPRHDSRIEHGDFLQFSVAQRGCSLSGSNQPVCHVSWEEAQAFCRWLSERSGRSVQLPSGDAWEYASRAGAATPMAYGEVTTDFSRLANLADVNLRRPTGYRSGSVPEWRPAVTTVNDGHWVSAPVASYPPNAWGLHDMQGNVWEWTSDVASDGVRRLARGGSWYVRPHRATPDATLAYQPWQKIYDVGFRVLIDSDSKIGLN